MSTMFEGPSDELTWALPVYTASVVSDGCSGTYRLGARGWCYFLGRHFVL